MNACFSYSKCGKEDSTDLFVGEVFQKYMLKSTEPFLFYCSIPPYTRFISYFYSSSALKLNFCIIFLFLCVSLSLFLIFFFFFWGWGDSLLKWCCMIKPLNYCFPKVPTYRSMFIAAFSIQKCPSAVYKTFVFCMKKLTK